MKFKCIYRDHDGSKKYCILDALNRTEAFKQANDKNLTVIEMCPLNKTIHNSKKIKSSSSPNVKYPNSEELKILEMRKTSFWIGFWVSFFGPLLWLIACIVTLCKYERRGLMCCLSGLTTPIIVLGLPLVSLCLPVYLDHPFHFVYCIFGLVMFVFGIWLVRFFYKRDVLCGFILPKNNEFHKAL